jgi:gamma-glutamyltranspeptidase
VGRPALCGGGGVHWKARTPSAALAQEPRHASQVAAPSRPALLQPPHPQPPTPPHPRTAFQIIDQKCGDAAAPLLASSGKGPAAGELLKNPLVADVMRRLGKLGAHEGGSRYARQGAGGCGLCAGALGAGKTARHWAGRLRAARHTHPLSDAQLTPSAPPALPSPNPRPPGFYTGPVADAIVEAIQSRGGVMAKEDLAAHHTLEVEPISTDYRWGGGGVWGGGLVCLDVNVGLGCQ